MRYDQVNVNLDEAVATVRMSNPAKLNALSRTMTTELIDVFGRLSEEEAIRAVVLIGEGRGFSAGADLGDLEEAYRRGERPKLSGFLRDGYNQLIPLIARAPKPVIAAVNGAAAGAGLSLALACDIRVASEAATFNTAFVHIGLVPDSGACYFLPRTVGIGRALEMAITGERVAASAAREMGLVGRVVPAEALEAEALALARKLAAMPTAAIALTKRLFREAATLPLEQTLEREAEGQDLAGASDDHMEGVLAFLEKRRPTFTGR